MSWDIESFRQKLEDQHGFPGYYSFKFIVPLDKKDALLNVLPEAEISLRNSSTNKYVSITARAYLQKSQEVIDVYFGANTIEGCMPL